MRHLATHRDTVVYGAFLKVMNLMAPSTSLMRPDILWQVLCGGKTEQAGLIEARDLLAPVCDQFTEGFDTPDLTDAKTLLDELS